ncbi:hypothetical protein FHG87_018775 [Trinorchestia longiramus]|nr:hypothetical protein FHG87_018775 [Trinorchestia longiramus]
MWSKKLRRLFPKGGENTNENQKSRNIQLTGGGGWGHGGRGGDCQKPSVDAVRVLLRGPSFTPALVQPFLSGNCTTVEHLSRD